VPLTVRLLFAPYSPGGGRVLSGSYDKTIKLWDADTGTPIRTFNENNPLANGLRRGGRLSRFHWR
jgi:WD40 repeat protein